MYFILLKLTRQISLNGFLSLPAFISNLKRFIADVLSPFIHAFARKDENFSLRFFKISNLIIRLKIHATKRERMAAIVISDLHPLCGQALFV